MLSSSQQPLLTPAHCHPTGTNIIVLQSPKLKTSIQKKTPAKTPLANVMTNQLMSTRGPKDKGIIIYHIYTHVQVHVDHIVQLIIKGLV